MTTALVPVGDLEKMAHAVAASKLFGITNVEQALALMLVAQAEGLHPATAARDYHIIQGRPALKADAMLARYLNSGGKVEWHDHTDAKVSATFTHPAGGTLTIDWDFARAKMAGLGNKDMWLKYPRQMLRARVISEGIRATNPAVASGIYTPEEVQDMEPQKPARKEKNMGNAVVVGAAKESAAPQATSSSPHAPSTSATADAADPITPEQVRELNEMLLKCPPKTQGWLLVKAGVKTLGEIQAIDYPEALEALKRKVA